MSATFVRRTIVARENSMSDDSDKETKKLLGETLNLSMQTSIILSRLLQGLEASNFLKISHGKELEDLISTWRSNVTNLQERIKSQRKGKENA